MQRESTPLELLRASVEQAGITDRVGSTIKMFTGAGRWQIKHTFGTNVSLHGVYFVIKVRTIIVIISGKSFAERQPCVSSYEATP
jgi:hypothetical protein